MGHPLRISGKVYGAIWQEQLLCVLTPRLRLPGRARLYCTVYAAPYKCRALSLTF
jgi:hypothetical protein